MKYALSLFSLLFVLSGFAGARPITLEDGEDLPRPIRGGNSQGNPTIKPPTPRVEVDPETRTITVSAPSAQVTLVNLFTGETRHADVQGFYVVSDLPSDGVSLITVSGESFPETFVAIL
ncbi:MAG: hypothetical protein J6M31_07015 [Bacteroidales bacterium]|nr:hypothetical protein [Bacteroidales bacterium]